MAIMRSRLKNKRGKFFSQTGIKTQSPGTESQYATNELCFIGLLSVALTMNDFFVAAANFLEFHICFILEEKEKN